MFKTFAVEPIAVPLKFWIFFDVVSMINKSRDKVEIRSICYYYLTFDSSATLSAILL